MTASTEDRAPSSQHRFSWLVLAAFWKLRMWIWMVLPFFYLLWHWSLSRKQSFKRWPPYFLYFRSQKQSWNKAGTHMQALNVSRVTATWSSDSAIAALGRDRISHSFPGLVCPTASSGLLTSQNNLVFSTSVWNGSAHPVCSTTFCCL